MRESVRPRSGAEVLDVVPDGENVQRRVPGADLEIFEQVNFAAG